MVLYTYRVPFSNYTTVLTWENNPKWVKPVFVSDISHPEITAGGGGNITIRRVATLRLLIIRIIGRTSLTKLSVKAHCIFTANENLGIVGHQSSCSRAQQPGIDVERR